VIADLEFAVRPPAGPDPAGTLVLLHGRGADQHDLLPVADAIDPEGRLFVLSPRGPLSLPPGGAHWYRLAGIPTPDPETFTATRERLAGWLDSVPEHTGVPWERTVLGGFSQGTVMSYAMGLGEGRPSPAGILAMSGFIPEVPGFALDLAGRRGLPVAISHGTLDQVIPARFGREAAERLQAAGLAVEFRETPVGHGVDPRLIPELRNWLAARTAG
jgi:phospholipase/carboxylesterase